MDDLHRQVQALRAGHDLLQASDVLALQEQFEGAPEVLSMQLAFSLGDHAGDAKVREALGIILKANIESPFVRQAVVRALSGKELQFMRDYLVSDQLVDDTVPARLALNSDAIGSWG